MEQIQYRDTVAVINLGAYKSNLRKIKRFVGNAVGIMAVVKANAYGHGLVECAGTALEAGASMLCVALVSEGVILREAGINAPILVFVPESPSSWRLYCNYGLTMTIISADMLDDVRQLLGKNTAGCRAHINVDTGMGRVGVHPDKAAELVDIKDNLRPFGRGAEKPRQHKVLCRYNRTKLFFGKTSTRRENALSPEN